jgi:uncharacterized DUF497 family protein
VSFQFSWDPAKAATNLRKHGVTFREAATVFGDPDAVTVYDEAHSGDEERWFTLGRSLLARLLAVAHTETDEEIRIISARRATLREAASYAL